MSVRRLADDHLQPGAFAFKPAFASQAKGWIKKYPKGREQSAVIPLLMLAQEQDGWVTKAAIEHISSMLDMPKIRVLEVATFYTQFQLKPVGTRAHVQVCGTTPCMLRGSEALMDVCRSKIHRDQFQLNEAGTLSWEEVECLGACVNAPMVMIFKDTYEDLTPERLAEIIDAFEAGKGDTITPGPQNGRTFSAPMGRLTSLTDENAILVGKGRVRVEAPATAPVAPAQPFAAPQAPTKAAKPKTDAPEGNPVLKTPVQARKAAPRKLAPAKLLDVPKAAPAAKAASAKPAANGKPELLKKPRSGKGDDLKLIWGVGPKLEKMLNAMGIWHFDQIAAWGKAELKWVDDRLEGFTGRASRDEWVKQAKKLAKGWRPDSAVGDKPGRR